MENKIPQSFKVQWLNSTLQFVKNDYRMVMEYPQMPIAHVEYLRNVIWQRQINVGLGFKSLYAPLWEAMSIYSVKYQFEFSVTKAASGKLAHLKIQKIPKATNEDCDKPPLEPNIREMKKSTSPVCEEPVIERNKIEKVKIKLKRPSDGRKYLVHSRKIIDSIEPAFFKTTFQKILDFINDEASGSVIFSDLTRNEAKFLENFLGIYNRRMYFGGFFSPYCNDLLDKICKSFKVFDENTKLNINVGKTVTRTGKWQIVFLKLPRYTKYTSSKAKLSNNNNGQLYSKNDLDSFRCTNNSDASIYFLNSDSHSITDNTDTETDEEFKFDPTDKENVKSMVFNKVKLQDAQNTAPVNLEKNSDTIEINNESKMKSTVKAREVFEFGSKSTINVDLHNEYVEFKEETKIIDNSNINYNLFKDIEETKITVNNKMETVITDDVRKKMRSVYLKDNSTEITPQIPKIGISFAKASERTNNEEVEDKSANAKVIQGSRKNKLLQAMSTPLESDKASRMMRLMGWEGGALGLRGEGIIEPIIPALNIKPGAGLGHVSGKPKKKQDKISNRLQLLEAILDFITKDITQLIIIFNSDVTKKEKRSFHEIINIINMNKPWNLVVSPENDLFQKIHENMMEAQFKLDLVRDYNRKFILSKILRTEIKGKKSKKEKKQTTPTSIIELPVKKAQFKILVLTKILEFQKDKQNPVLNLHFNSILNKRHRKFLEQLCSSVNKRVMMTNNQVPFKDLVVELCQSLDNSFFDITFGLDSRSFTMRKVEENPETDAVFKKENVETETVDEIQNTLSEISLTDADLSVLCENKTDNAINKQETDKKDSENGNVKDNNNDYGPKEFEPNTGQEVSSDSSTCPKKYEPYILLVKTKTYRCPTDVADLIATKIDSEIQFTPYLKSHGVQDGYMVYSCYKKKSYLWLKKLLKEYQVIGYRGMDEMYALKSEINVNLNFETVSSLLEKYNPGLDTSGWSVLDVYYTNYCKEFLVQLDFNSFEYIRNNNFRLPAGIDDVRFSINIDYYLRYYNRL